MDHSLRIGSVPQIARDQGPREIAQRPATQSGAFGDILSAKLENSTNPVKFSAHAIKRMQERNIQLAPEDMEKLKAAMGKMQEKGSKESLILSDKGAFIVNIRDQKVITAIDPKEVRNNSFTNIDSTMII